MGKESVSGFWFVFLFVLFVLFSVSLSDGFEVSVLSSLTAGLGRKAFHSIKPIYLFVCLLFFIARDN